MTDGEIAVFVILLVIYSILSICLIATRKSTSGSITATVCCGAGGFALYYLVPLVISILMGLLELIIAIAFIAAIISGLSGG